MKVATGGTGKGVAGGTGPIWPFRHFLGTPVVTIGAGDQLSKNHAPDESISVDLLELATRQMARLLVAFAAAGSPDSSDV